MKSILIMLALLVLVGCGYEQRDGELIGQVKKVSRATPIICSEWRGADISLGVMRNGVGSMSTEDVWVVVQNDQDYKLLSDAASNGKIVKITFDVKRIAMCTADHIATKVEYSK